jgi:hypothetical protein
MCVWVQEHIVELVRSSEGSQSRQAVKYGRESRGTRKITVLARSSSNLAVSQSKNIDMSIQATTTEERNTDFSAQTRHGMICSALICL